MCLLIPAEISTLLTSLTWVLCETGAPCEDGIVICGTRGIVVPGCDWPRSDVAEAKNHAADIAKDSLLI